MNILEKIAQFIQDISYTKLPAIAINSVKKSFLDTLGITLAGTNEDASMIITEYAKENQGKAVCTVIGANFKTSAVDAALVNGTILHSLDFDDTGAFTQGHPSAPIFPVILAIAEENQNSGREIIEAYTIGVEIQSRLSQGMPMLHLRGWHPTSVFGAIAAAGVASKLLKLNVNKTINALSIAGSMSSGLVKNFGTMTKPLHAGRAASNGILAAKLAYKGFSGSEKLFDNESSFQKSFWGNNSEQLKESIENIGKPFRVASPGINIKKYPACSLTHRAIDAVLYIMSNHEISVKNIKLIECFVTPRAVSVLFYTKPKTKLEAKFSMQFVLAATVFFGELNLSHFSDEVVKHPKLVELMSRIYIKVHNDWKDGDDKRADKVVIKLTDHRCLSKEIAIPKGNVKNPISEEELIKKFTDCTKSLNAESQKNIINKIDKLEELKSINELIDLISLN